MGKPMLINQGLLLTITSYKGMKLSEKPKNGQTDAHHEKQIRCHSLTKLQTKSWGLNNLQTRTTTIVGTFERPSIHYHSDKVPETWLLKLKEFQQLKQKKKQSAFLNRSTKVSHLTKPPVFMNSALVPPSKIWQMCVCREFWTSSWKLRNMSTKDIELEDFLGSCMSSGLQEGVLCGVHFPVTPPKPFSFEFEPILSKAQPTTGSRWCQLKHVPRSNSKPSEHAVNI